MKKYKLKQWYPALPNHVKVGDIATEVTEYGDNGLSYNVFKIFFNDDKWHIVSKRELHPDFWELIEEEKPLFVTEDGVECFDGDEYIAISDAFSKVAMIAIAHAHTYSLGAPYSGDVMRFKYESNADEYIWRNKPLFSYEDFMKWGNVPYERVIKQLAKERVKP